MRLPHGIRRTFRLLVPGSFRDEVEEELRFHVEERARELVESGMEPEEARREAERRLGSLEGVRSACRELAEARERRFRWRQVTDELRQDLVSGVRQLAKAPGSSLLAVLALALGIGATTALFAALYAVVLEPLPFPEPHEVVRLWEVRELSPGDGGTGPQRGDLSAGNFLELQERQSSFAALAAAKPRTFDLLRGETPERVFGARVTPGYFRVFGIEPLHGRLFAPDEGGESAVAVLGHRLWSEAFGSDPGAVGGTVRIDGRPHTVVGVLPSGYEPVLGDQGIWTLLDFPSDPVVLFDEHTYDAVGRLAEGVSLAGARAELRTLGRRLERLQPELNRDRSLVARPYERDLLGSDRQRLWVLFGAVTLVLLIACGDVAGILLARGAERDREMAIRASLGARPGRLLRQLLTESLVLAGAGAAAGLALAWAGLEALIALSPVRMPRLDEAGLDPPVLAFTLAAAGVACLLSGLAPAWRLAKDTPREALGASFSARGREPKLGRLLVAAQVALSVVLLAGAGLLIRTALELQRVDPGFEPTGALSLRLAFPEARYGSPEAVERGVRRVIEEVGSLPGVGSAAAVSQIPLGGGSVSNGLVPEGAASRDDAVLAELRLSTPEVFEALGVPLLSGRTFDARDRRGAPPVMVVNRAFAERAFPGEDPVGKRVACCVDEDHPDLWREVVGVVGSTRARGLGMPVPPEFYLPVAQAPERAWDWLQRTLVLVVRAEADRSAREAAERLIPAVREAVLRADPTLPVWDLATLDQRLSASLDRARSSSLLLTLFGLVALVLAGAGIYGVLAVHVGRRRSEVGVRMALGATRAGVVGLVLGQALRPTLAGVAVGLVGALAVGRLLTAFLYGVSPADPATLAAVAGILTAVALLAAWLPARRAARLDPATTLRAE